MSKSNQIRRLNSVLDDPNPSIEISDDTIKITRSGNYYISGGSANFTLPPGHYVVEHEYGIEVKQAEYMKSPLWKVLNGKSEEQADVSKGRFRDQQGYNKKTQESSKKVTEDSKGN